MTFKLLARVGETISKLLAVVGIGALVLVGIMALVALVTFIFAPHLLATDRQKRVGNTYYVDHGRESRGKTTASEARGDAGEDSVREILDGLDKNHYAVYHDIVVPGSRGKTQIDHIVVSEYGVFVIETKNYRGWIFGDARDRTWTQSLRHHATGRASKRQFQNPLRQNYGHAKAVEEHCGLSSAQIMPIVVFSKNCEFKTAMPEKVIFVGGLYNFIVLRQSPLLSEEDVERAMDRLDAAAAQGGIGRQTNRSFLSALRGGLG